MKSICLIYVQLIKFFFICYFIFNLEMSEISKNLQELKKNISALTEFSVGKNSFFIFINLKNIFYGGLKSIETTTSFTN